MHRDIVPRAFACDYTLVADLLKRVADSFREHRCLNGRRTVSTPAPPRPRFACCKRCWLRSSQYRHHSKRAWLACVGRPLCCCASPHSLRGSTTLPALVAPNPQPFTSSPLPFPASLLYLPSLLHIMFDFIGKVAAASWRPS